MRAILRGMVVLLVLSAASAQAKTPLAWPPKSVEEFRAIWKASRPFSPKLFNTFGPWHGQWMTFGDRPGTVKHYPVVLTGTYPIRLPLPSPHDHAMGFQEVSPSRSYEASNLSHYTKFDRSPRFLLETIASDSVPMEWITPCSIHSEGSLSYVSIVDRSNETQVRIYEGKPVWVHVSWGMEGSRNPKGSFLGIGGYGLRPIGDAEFRASLGEVLANRPEGRSEFPNHEIVKYWLKLIRKMPETAKP